VFISFSFLVCVVFSDYCPSAFPDVTVKDATSRIANSTSIRLQWRMQIVFHRLRKTTTNQNFQWIFLLHVQSKSL